MAAAVETSCRAAGAGDRDVVIEIETFEMAGRVLDEHDSAPIEGVSMRLENLAGDQVAYGSLGSGAISDSDGYSRLIGIAMGDYRVVVEKDGYAALDFTLEGEPQGEMEIALRPTQGVRLEVFLPSGVRASEVSASVMTSLDTVLVSRASQIISQGRLRLGSVPPGDWRILLQSADSAVTAVEISVPSALVPVQLQRGTKVHVTVTALDGDLTGLARIRLLGDDARAFRSLGYAPREEWSTHRGRATIDHVPSGAWTVEAETPDGRSWQRRIHLDGGAVLEVELP